MTHNELIDNITEAVASVLKTGSSAPKVYVRVRPDGTAATAEESGWTCSEDEYFKRVPHTLSLEIGKETRDYSHLSEDEIEECADAAEEVSEQIVEYWKSSIEEWISAGNINLVNAA